MEVILKKTIDTLGREGDVVNVKPGYARNYLLPQNMASALNKASLARLRKEQDAIAKRIAEEKKNAEALTAQLEDVTVVVSCKTGSEGRLFGSVNNTDVAERLAQIGVVVDRRNILMADPIKTVGETKVVVKVGYQMTCEVTVRVVPESETEEA